ncbi:hypothetical protein [Lentzea kentuckyensis]|uniref:hypothetical protein n=1 Tax=Lentzea kentuckyensis TaxID=360086 RepID=UPI000A39070C|nr:hypothetical protein [Lentzea kentuckyensis]
MITPATRLIDEQARALRDALTAAIRSTRTELPHLAAKLTAQRHSTRTRAEEANSVFPAIVAAALDVDPKPALPLCTASALWWISVDSEAVGAQCGAMLAMRHLGTARGPDGCKLAWFDEFARSSTAVIETRLAARGRRAGDISRKSVLAHHLGITGAAHARDAAMAAHLAEEHAVDGWREFGALYGLIRQLHTDHVRSTVDDDGNATLIVPPLLLAHAFELGNSGMRRELVRLPPNAPARDPGQHTMLRDLLRSPRTVAAYARDLRRLHRRASARLDDLHPAGAARTALRSTLDATLELTMPGAREIIGG